jgi:uncharacterized membrane-anchored protein YhcB (DUF1043 family)
MSDFARSAPLSSALSIGLLAVLCLAAGAAAGWFLRRLFDPAEQRILDLERRLTEADNAMNEYRRGVTEHFRGTAERVNRLTEDYRELHAHLSEGAITLCDTSSDGTQTPLLTSLGASPRSATPAPAGPPLDYAPPRADGDNPGEDLDFERIHGV